MGKKKQFKADGTEDFELEATEPEETTDDAGSISDMLAEAKDVDAAKDEGEAKSEPEAEPAPEDGHPNVNAALADAKGVDVADATADAPSDATGAVPPLSAPDGTASTETPDVATDEAQDAPKDAPVNAPAEDEAPKLTEALPEAAPAVDIAPDVMDELKDAGNKLSPALKRLAEFEDKFAELESEAKARFDHMRHKITEAVAALEGIFKRS